MVSEYVSGRTFAEALASGRRMAFQRVHSLGRVIAQVLSLLHQKGLVHGSIRPSNIMVSSGVIKLADLGLARLARRGPDAFVRRAPRAVRARRTTFRALRRDVPPADRHAPALPCRKAPGCRCASGHLTPGVPESWTSCCCAVSHPRPELRLASAEDLQQELREMVEDRLSA